MMGTMPLTVTLYIHPDIGPISLISINMLEIETMVDRLSTGTNHDEARIKEIMKRINNKYPYVDLQNRQHDLAFLISKLSKLSDFNGIVLRLHGSIDGPQPPKDITTEEIKRMVKEIEKLKGQLEDKNRTNEELSQRIPRLESEGTRLGNLCKRLRHENEDMREALKESAESSKQAQNQVNHYKGRVATLEKEKAELQTRCEALSRNGQRSLASQQEVADLRQRLQSALKAKQQLSESLTRAEKEQDGLRLRLKQLVDVEGDRPTERQANPYLDL